MKYAVIIALCLLVGFPARSLAAPPIEKVLAWLEQTNERIRVVKTAGYTHEYLWDDSTSSWKVTPETSTFDCVMENKPKGRYVLNQTPLINRWIAGTAPYLATWATEFRDGGGFITYWSRATQSYDGRQFLGVPQSRCMGDLADRRKDSADTVGHEMFLSGLRFTGFEAVNHTPVAAPWRFKGIVVSDTEDGMTRIQYTVPEICLGFEFVLDPRKAFALVRYEYSDNRQLTTADEERTFTYEVLEHRQVADGVWYPVHCVETTKFSKEYATLMRLQYPQEIAGAQDDAFLSRQRELVLTNVTLLAGDDAETNLSVKLPDGLTIREQGER